MTERSEAATALLTAVQTRGEQLLAWTEMTAAIELQDAGLCDIEMCSGDIPVLHLRTSEAAAAQRPELERR